MAADWEGARNRYPIIEKSVDPDVWIRFFEENPEDLTRLIRWIFQVLNAPAARRGGTRERVTGTWDAVWDLLSPRYSSDPFPIAVQELMGTDSLRAFAEKVPMGHQRLWEMMNHKRGVNILRRTSGSIVDVEATMTRLATIARAGKVGPAYFVEWRNLWLQQALTSALTVQPNLSIALMKQLSGVAQ